ncbi:HpcH/HpaI aldolase/citrate lyase family protein [Jhaorihella thermophila]|uniref:Citrate lyase subunit beta / citryl-CoA lyase n=1 Tax=Jhaorihella thermophila TaxID=488547 RepID=A0A1H5UG02_9RHOB|nr:CoA ester lyase [Jhaorihella thermophila]SEF73956.1 citrate lyase subunit beta / citryl-CoA lyase [Jhaorihella thermophila]
MPLPPHPFGTWLFVPGDDAKKLAKASACGADVVIFDLEDAVAPARKDVARSLTLAALRRREGGPARYVRVNELSSGRTAEDVGETIDGCPDGYVLPKCEGPEDIEALAAMIRAHRSDPQPGIVAISTETARAVRNLMRLDWAHPMLVGLAWGGEDLQADLGARSNRGESGEYLSPFVLARDLALLVARDAGVLAIDAVYTDFRDVAGLRGETQQSRRLGFDGKMAIHPAQLPVIRECLSPDADELDWARRVVALLEASGTGVAELDGKMLDRPHLTLARRILGRGAGGNG